MPVRRGHVAPKTTLIETIIRKFDTHNRSFLVANALSENFHIIFCSDGFCKMTGFTRAEVMQRSASTEFLHGPMTSQLAVNLIKESLSKGVEKHFEILYYRKNAQKFLCSEVIAPIRSEADDISLFIINFEDLTHPQQVETALASRLSKFDRARASFRQSLRFGSMGIRDRGLRLAGYLTPPSDVTQEEEESEGLPKKIENEKSWTPMSTPAIPRSVEVETLKPKDALGLEEIKIVPKKHESYKKQEFGHTKSLDFENQVPKNPEQKLLQIYETNAKNCRGLIQKRAHTVDDFMKGTTTNTTRQYFPYVSSESDLQRYKAISFHQNNNTNIINNNNNNNTNSNTNNGEHGSSSLSNVPSDKISERCKLSRILDGSGDVDGDVNDDDDNNDSGGTQNKKILHTNQTHHHPIEYRPNLLLFQDNGSAKYFQGSRHASNMGEKVAQKPNKRPHDELYYAQDDEVSRKSPRLGSREKCVSFH